jgi:hypothetical protein
MSLRRNKSENPRQAFVPIIGKTASEGYGLNEKKSQRMRIKERQAY